jgi:hypothetical protein
MKTENKKCKRNQTTRTEKRSKCIQNKIKKIKHKKEHKRNIENEDRK